MDSDDGGAQWSQVKPRAPAPPEFVAFFRRSYIELQRRAMYVGANAEEAKDAAASAMVEVLVRWDDIDSPIAYATRATINAFLKDKQRGLDRTRRRMVEQGMAPSEAGADARMALWEDREWVVQMLQPLPPEQRAVMALVVDNFTPAEIAVLLGKSPAAVRQCLRAARQRLKQLRRAEQQAVDPAGRSTGSQRREEP